jgi:hypothetical protein
VRINKAMEDEVSASLGGLLGLLEVLAIDAEPPLSTRQQRCLDEALRLGDALRSKVEALVTLLSDEADPRFAKSSHALRRLIDHAVRAAGWSASERGVELRMPPAGPWEEALVSVDLPRTDRVLRAMTDALVACVGSDGGVVELAIELAASSVRLVLSARAENEPARLAVPQLVWAAWQQLIMLQGGTLELDTALPRLCLTLPRAASEGPLR